MKASAHRHVRTPAEVVSVTLGSADRGMSGRRSLSIRANRRWLCSQFGRQMSLNLGTIEISPISMFEFRRHHRLRW
jgi:hypothetical protein